MDAIISETSYRLINDQIAHELHNEQQYRTFASWANSFGLDNIKAYFIKQSEDERGHAQKFTDYLMECNQTLSIPSIDLPEWDFTDCAEIADMRYALEMETTQQVDVIMAQAMIENDYGLQDLMQWFCREQKSELAEALQLIALVKQSGGNSLLLDVAIGSHD